MCLCVHVCVGLCACVCVCVCVCIGLCVFAWVCVHRLVCVCVCVFVRRLVCVRGCNATQKFNDQTSVKSARHRHGQGHSSLLWSPARNKQRQIKNQWGAKECTVHTPFLNFLLCSEMEDLYHSVGDAAIFYAVDTVSHVDTCGAWWLIGRFVAFRPKRHGFESRSGRHVGTLDTVFVLCQEQLWVVVDLKRCYRNSINEWTNEWMNFQYVIKSSWDGPARVTRFLLRHSGMVSGHLPTTSPRSPTLPSPEWIFNILLNRLGTGQLGWPRMA